MEDGDVGAFVVLILVLIFGILIGTVLGSGMVGSKLQGLGEMVCQERGHGDFVKFDNEKKEIVCEPKKRKERFDGGHIRIENSRGGE